MPTKIFKQANILPSYNLFLLKKDFKILTLSKDLKVLISTPQKTPFVFSSLVPSICADLGQKGAILVQVAIYKDKKWSPFYKIFYLSKDIKKTFKSTKDNFAKINVDTILPLQGAQFFKYQITLLNGAKINLVCASLTNKNIKPNKELSLETLGVKNIELAVPAISQKEFSQKTLRSKICSPTCITMSLNYFGKKVSLQKTVKNVFDTQTKMYGTWPINTAYAGQHGLKCCFTYISSLAQAEAEIYQARPIIASVSFKNGALKNAPLKETKGHLIVLIGINKENNFICLDPAAPNKETVRRVYTRQDLARVWLKNKSGAAYAFGEDK